MSVSMSTRKVITDKEIWTPRGGFTLLEMTAGGSSGGYRANGVKSGGHR
jgi:hypothetical protein